MINWKDQVRDIYLRQDFNCAETVLKTANELYHLELTDEDIKMFSGFGAGMNCGKTCGAVLSALATVSKLTVQQRAHATEGFHETAGGLVERMEEKLGSVTCEELVKKYKREDVRCLETVETVLEILQDYLEEQKDAQKENKRPLKVLIIGGVAGGASAAARLRRLKEDAQIILFEKGSYISFANCGIPYYLGGIIESQQELLLQTPESFYDRFRVEVRIKSEVIDIRRTEKKVLVRDKDGKVYEESYDKLILSPGAIPACPKIAGIDLPGVYTLRDIPDALKIEAELKKKEEKNVVIIGGGNIGVELAENLSLKKCKVTVIESTDHLIMALDREMAVPIHEELMRHGVTVMLNRAVTAISKKGSKLEVRMGEEEIETELVILCTGVIPNSALAEKAGLEVNARKYIVTKENLETSDPDIYAVGDVIEVKEFVSGQRGNIALAGPANRQGRIAADQIAGIDSRYGGTQGSSIVKAFGLSAAATGLNEKKAQELKLDYDKIYLYMNAHAGYYPGGKMLTIKVLFERATGKLLGGQFVGEEGADKRCDVFATALRAGLTGPQLKDLELCYAPPFASAKDPINVAGFIMENIMTQKVRNFQWEEVEKLDPENTILLDVRTRDEYDEGNVPGFINIPLHELRARLDELDGKKTVYIHCFSGLRSYVACRILSGYGMNCYNISGGYYVYGLKNKKL